MDNTVTNIPLEVNESYSTNMPININESYGNAATDLSLKDTEIYYSTIGPKDAIALLARIMIIWLLISHQILTFPRMTMKFIAAYLMIL